MRLPGTAPVPKRRYLTPISIVLAYGTTVPYQYLYHACSLACWRQRGRATRSAVWPLSALRFVWRLPDHLTRSSPLDAAGICDLAHASTSRLSAQPRRAHMRPLRALLLLHFAWSTLQSSTGGELEEFLERRGDDSPVAHTDYDGSRRTPRSGPRGAEVAADGEPRNIMTAFEFNNLCADLENTRFDDDQEARLRRIICRRFGFGNEDGAGSQFGDGDDDADPDAEQNEIEDWMSQNALEWDASLEPQLEDEEQLVLEIFEQEWDTDLDIWRRAYEMDDELREEQDLTSWADWWYYHFSGQPSRKEKGVYLLKNVVPVDGSYHFIKSYQLPSAWTVSLPVYKNQNTSANAVHERHERREHHVVRDTRDAAFARRRVRG